MGCRLRICRPTDAKNLPGSPWTRMQFPRPVRFNRVAFHAEREVVSVRSSITVSGQGLTTTASGNGLEPR